MIHRLGLRFRVQCKNLPGKPDAVLKRHRLVVFVHGCFWHRHRKCKYAYTPKSNLPFWTTKFSANVERDKRKASELRRLGWRVITIWECQTKDRVRLEKRLRTLLGLSP